MRHILLKLFSKKLLLLTLRLRDNTFVAQSVVLFNWIKIIVIEIITGWKKSKTQDKKISHEAEHLDKTHSVIQYVLNTHLELRTLLSTPKWKGGFKNIFALWKFIEYCVCEMINKQMILTIWSRFESKCNWFHLKYVPSVLYNRMLISGISKACMHGKFIVWYK